MHPFYFSIGTQRTFNLRSSRHLLRTKNSLPIREGVFCTIFEHSTFLEVLQILLLLLLLKGQIKWRRGEDSNLRYLNGIQAFQACTIDHSDTSPQQWLLYHSLFTLARAKAYTFNYSTCLPVAYRLIMLSMTCTAFSIDSTTAYSYWPWQLYAPAKRLGVKSPRKLS